PSNSYIYLYGNMDMAEKLEFLDREYLSGFDFLEVDSRIGVQKGFDLPKETRREYSIMEGESEQGNTYLTYNAVVGDNLDRKLYIAFQTLDYALCSAPGAPMKEALMEKGIGKEIYSTYDNGVMQPYFSIVAKGAEEGQKEEFVHVIESVLKEQAEKGIDRKALKAGLNYLEFKYRESDFGSYPKGLMVGLQALDSWLYDDRKPLVHVEANETFAALKEELDKGYYEDLIRKYLLDNGHKSVLVLAPVKGLTAKRDGKLQKKLQEYKAGLSREEIEEVVKQTKELEEYQEEPNRKEDLEKIPLLKREDIKKEAEKYVNEERFAGDTLILTHNIFTNGIGYLRFMFDIGQIPGELFPYIGVLKNVLGMVDTENYTYGDLYHETNIKTGGIHLVVNTYIDSSNMPDYKVMLEIKAKALYENM
ncbi:MAG: insulinase family protein, partial [Kineothrix sp.]|nr:insulinase family protein [Kineothrix sp.]